MAKLIDYIDKIIDNRGKNPNYLQIGKYPVIDNVAIGGRMYPDIGYIHQEKMLLIGIYVHVKVLCF